MKEFIVRIVGSEVLVYYIRNVSSPHVSLADSVWRVRGVRLAWCKTKDSLAAYIAPGSTETVVCIKFVHDALS